MSEKKKGLPPIETRALRTRKEGTFERLLCQLLISSNNSEGLKKIEKMCEAYQRAKSMLPQNPGKIDEKEVEIIYTVVTTLRNTSFHNISNRFGRFVKIMWPFDYTTENYDKFIRPWRKTVAGLVYYPYVGGGNPIQIENRIKEYNDFIGTLGEISRFFTLTAGVLATGGLLCEPG